LSINLGPLAIQTSHLLLLMSMLVAAIVGHLVGRPQRLGIGNVLIDMLLAAMLVARIVFVAVWSDQYRDAPWSAFDIRDGGFNSWAGLAAATAVAIWQASKHPELHKPLSLGLLAGTLAWTMSGAPGMLGVDAQMALPAVELKTLTGDTTNLAALSHGKPMVVNLWATWCPPCRREMPVLAEAQQRETGVTFVFVSQGDDTAKVQRYLSSSQLNLANVLLDSHSEMGHAIGSTALPTSLLYDASGHLVDSHVGALSSATLADKLVALHSHTSNPLNK
jgi:thiol-disulfide isomerase/thioredoxin